MMAFSRGKMSGWVVLCWAGSWLLALACSEETTARLTGSCDLCASGPDWSTTEYCVNGIEGRKYCARACSTEQDCGVDEMCTSMIDLGAREKSRAVDHWVCMPNSFVASKMNGRLLRVVENCVKGGPHPCPPNMTCMMDASEPGSAFFCTNQCREHADCLSECCYDSSFGLNPEEKYCAPLSTYCPTR